MSGEPRGPWKGPLERVAVDQASAQVQFKLGALGTSLVVQWLRICLPMQGTRVRSLVWELRSHMQWGN